MKFLTGLFVLAACLQPYMVWSEAAAASAAAAASSDGDNGSAAAAAAAASAAGGGDGGGSTAAASAAGAGAGGGSAAAVSAAGTGSGGGSAASASAAGGGDGGGSAAATSAAGAGASGGSAAAASAAGAGAGGGSAAAASAAGGGAGRGSAAASAAAATTSCSRAHIECNCNNVYEPVCGTNGWTYANKCILDCISAYNVAHRYPAIGVHRRGECPRPSCVCTKEYNPICGADGNTYANKCLFDCENARRDSIKISRIGIKYYGPCKKHVCSCSDAIIPVCGSDGKTYRNICILQCYSRRNEAQGKDPIYYKSGGACAMEKCSCKIVDDPICASDGNTYKNYCVLQCQNRRRDHLGQGPLGVQYRGKCLNCVCPAVYSPVCADNGVTYGNECILNCENRRRASLKPPLPPLVVNCRCACTCKCKLIYQPVCTWDNRTFNNKCLLKCENRRRRDVGLPPLYFKRYGRCSCNCNYCPNTYDPVCGSDGRSYWNLCYLNCNRSCYYDPNNPLQRVPCV